MSSRSSAVLGNHRLTLENTPARENSPFTWADLVTEWKQYIEEKASQFLVFIEKQTEELSAVPYSHRFQQEYTRMQYAKIQDFIRGSLSEYENPHLVFLTFSTSTLKLNGDPRPPLDHLDELVETWNNGVYYELNQVMGGERKTDPWTPRDWEYLYILEPTTNEGNVPGGYAHAHCAIVVDGEVDSRRFESVINRHLVEAPNAKGEAHEFDKTIEVKEAEELGNPGAYLFKYLGKSWDVDDMADYEERFASLLFDQGRQRFRASNGAQRWLQRDEDESGKGNFIFAGIGNSEQVFHLMQEYEDLDEFRIAHETSVRGWLNQNQISDETAPKTPKKTIQISHEQFNAGGFEQGRSLLAAVGGGDRPPPAG